MKKLLVFGGLVALIAIVAVVLFKSSLVNSASAQDEEGWGACISTGPQCGTDNGTQSKTVSTQYTASCPEGFSPNSSEDWGHKCKKTAVITTDPIISCPDNYHYQNNGNFSERCHRNHNWQQPEHKSPIISCPQGYDKSGSGENTSCSKTTTTYSAPTTSCPDGYTKSGDGSETQCSKVITQSCQTGVIDNSACEKPTDVCPNIEGNQEVLPDGYHFETQDDIRVCIQDPQDEVTPTPTPQLGGGGGDAPTFAGSSTNPPVCNDGNTVQLPANAHVVRKGSEATVNFFITEGDSANIYYRVVGQSDWQYSVADVKPNPDNFVSYTVSGLDPQLGYEFGAQQKHGCGGGQLVTAVIVDGPVSRLFPFSYWEWSK